MQSKDQIAPLVSIALATYNGERFLAEQLDSLLQQTYQNFEVVISDDGSTDQTKQILEAYAAKDARIQWSVNEGQRGVILNFERAIGRCRGEIIFLCDQDDSWYPEKLERHLAAYSNKSVMWVYNEVRLTDQGNNQIGLLTDQLSDYWTRRKLLYYTWGSCVLGCATSYRASLLENIWPADINAPGHDSWIQLAIYPARPFHIPEVLQDYRQHASNLVGFKATQSEFDMKTEQKAIADNIRYLASLSKNYRFQFWKRVYFRTVYTLKLVRSALKSVIYK